MSTCSSGSRLVRSSSSRCQSVRLLSHLLLSASSKHGCGVPQGSILGSPFLNVHQDLPDTMPQADSFGYADDNKAIFSAESGLGRSVDALATWLKANKMSVNFSKTNIMNLKCKNDS